MKKSHRPAAPETQALPEPAKKLSGQTVFLWGAVAASIIGLAAIAFIMLGGRLWAADLGLRDIPFDGAKAYDYLHKICDLGPRRSGSEAFAAQQKLLKEHFEKLGAKVELQLFEADYPLDGPDSGMIGRKMPMANLIVRFNPENHERVMLCSHYDTLPFPLRDPVDRKGRFVGANDNGSGVAILMELGNELAKNPPKIGVDFVFFDGEEFIFSEEDKFFWGSEYFATDYAQHPPAFHYRSAVLLDMVGGTDLQLPKDLQSMSWDDTLPVVNDIWATAARLGVREFINRPTLEKIRDDHVALHDLGKIPACDMIDFSYKYWHTQGDVPEHCSALSLAKVGWVLREWLMSQ